MYTHVFVCVYLYIYIAMSKCVCVFEYVNCILQILILFFFDIVVTRYSIFICRDFFHFVVVVVFSVVIHFCKNMYVYVCKFEYFFFHFCKCSTFLTFTCSGRYLFKGGVKRIVKTCWGFFEKKGKWSK